MANVEPVLGLDVARHRAEVGDVIRREHGVHIAYIITATINVAG